MKKLLCKFANWILRQCTNPEVAFGADVYINGRTYTLIKATTEINPCRYSIMFEVGVERGFF